MMSDQDDFSGDQCMVLPKNYLNSAEAVAEIYEEELSLAADNLDVDELHGHRFLSGTLLASVIWALSGVWTVCY
jgi:hypothetical protein